MSLKKISLPSQTKILIMHNVTINNYYLATTSYFMHDNEILSVIHDISALHGNIYYFMTKSLVPVQLHDNVRVAITLYMAIYH